MENETFVSGLEVSRSIKIGDLTKLIKVNQIVSIFNGMFALSGKLCVKGVLGERTYINEDRVSYWLQESAGTNTSKVRLSMGRLEFEKTGIKEGDSVFAIGTMSCWFFSNDSMIGFSFDAEVVESCDQAPAVLSLEDRYAVAVNQRNDAAALAEALKKTLDSVADLVKSDSQNAQSCN